LAYSFDTLSEAAATGRNEQKTMTQMLFIAVPAFAVPVLKREFQGYVNLRDATHWPIGEAIREFAGPVVTYLVDDETPLSNAHPIAIDGVETLLGLPDCDCVYVLHHMTSGWLIEETVRIKCRTPLDLITYSRWCQEWMLRTGLREQIPPGRGPSKRLADWDYLANDVLYEVRKR